MQVDAPAFPTGLGLTEAQSRIVEIAAKYKLGTESILLQSALGRVLARDVIAPFDVPGFVNSAMDGYAVRGADLPAQGDTRLRLIGSVLAGGAAAPEVLPGTCVRITTGAPLPNGADTVVMKENTQILAQTDGDTVVIAAGTLNGANVRPAGEDYAAGDFALARGNVLTPARLGALASFGQTQVEVVRRTRAVLLTTGDELVAPGSPLGFGGIYDSNRYSLGALIEQHGAQLLRHERLRDDPALLREALLRAGEDADVVISSGGVSAGEADYLPRLLAEVGKVYFWKVRIKPGLPFLCGSAGSALVFALPGNPVSGIATFLTLVRPALDALSDRHVQAPQLRARLALALQKRHARTEFMRANLHCDESGTLHATPLRKQGSGMLRGVAEADALIVLPELAGEYAVGAIVDVLPLPGWP
ncbi:MAG TPA: gephyrin-like molybdotransferase Glp [Rudaea sp.]|jgi:molybdopterin molybdotransferase|uniref:molybdopterin molybdotransferase MoeA n=1 Tax=Rudaea sp. TaxID=2136325 RepID=UPI002F9253E3